MWNLFNNQLIKSFFSGKWSAEMPECITITCPSVETLDDTRLQLLEYNNTFGSRAIFTCMWGHKLLGPQSIECQGDGSWSGDKPSCVGVSNKFFFYTFFFYHIHKIIYVKLVIESKLMLFKRFNDRSQFNNVKSRYRYILKL